LFNKLILIFLGLANQGLMHNIHYLLLNKPLLKGLLKAFFAILILSVSQADAQRRKDPWSHYGGGGGSSESGYAITFSADYDAPAGILGNTFTPAPALTIGVVHYLGNFTFNANIGYHVYSPKQAIFSYDDGAGGTGTVVYDKYPVFAVYTGVVYNLQLADGVGIYAGVNSGIYATHYAYNAVDQFSTNSVDLT
jgi:hypothetical protein